jgi:hypothetical protein
MNPFYLETTRQGGLVNEPARTNWSCRDYPPMVQYGLLTTTEYILASVNWMLVKFNVAPVAPLIGTPFRYQKALFTRLPAARINQINEFTAAAWAVPKRR